MAVFASLNNLKKKVSEAVKDAVADGVGVLTKKEDVSSLNADELGPPSQESDSIFRQLGGNSGTPILVRYEVQNGDGADREGAVFALPIASNGECTVGHVRRHFPLSGRFHFRFKAPSGDSSFGGIVYVDAPCDREAAPIFRGEICIKVLKIPDDADAAPRLEPVPQGPLAAAVSAGASGQSLRPMRQHGSMMASASAAAERAANQLAEAFEPSPRTAPSDREFDQERRGRDRESLRAAFEVPRTPAPSLATGGSPSPEASRSPSPPSSPPVRPPDDLMEMDFGGPRTGMQIPTATSMSLAAPAGMTVSSHSPGSVSPPAAPSPPAQPLDRDQLRREREEREAERVREATNRQQEQLQKETQLKADKVEENNKLAVEMDSWAKTADGQNYKDVKVLISTMHTVLWPDSGWKELPLSELLGGKAAVKKWYYKAILVVHPDKQSEANAEQQVRADRIFQALNHAFKVSDEK